jgi:HD-like signal output (HDOD) protein
MNAERNLSQALKNLDSLPAIPDIAQKIMSLNLSAGENNNLLLELIVQDPPIMSKIIGLSNSPLFNPGKIITKLDYAVAFLGFKRVKVIALSFAIISSVTRKSAGQLDIQKLWNRSLAFTKVMDTLASYMPKDISPSDDDIYLAGLLHDLGFLVLDYLDPDLSDQFHARLNLDRDCSVEEIESELLGISHEEIGAILGQYWNLPANIVASIYNRQVINADQATAVQPLVVLTDFAEKLLPAFGFADATGKDIAEADWQSLGIDSCNADQIKSKVQKIILQTSTVQV